MTKQELNTIKDKLLQQKVNLEEELSKIATKNPHNENDYNANFEEYGADPTDSTEEVVKYSLNLTLEKTLEKELEDVNKSLKRIDENSYGSCKYCKAPIDVKRLMARPTSNACIACKNKLKSL